MDAKRLQAIVVACVVCCAAQWSLGCDAKKRTGTQPKQRLRRTHRKQQPRRTHRNKQNNSVGNIESRLICAFGECLSIGYGARSAGINWLVKTTGQDRQQATAGQGTRDRRTQHDGESTLALCCGGAMSSTCRCDVEARSPKLLWCLVVWDWTHAQSAPPWHQPPENSARAGMLRTGVRRDWMRRCHSIHWPGRYLPSGGYWVGSRTEGMGWLGTHAGRNRESGSSNCGCCWLLLAAHRCTVGRAVRSPRYSAVLLTLRLHFAVLSAADFLTPFPLPHSSHG
jgi:hypothetical protein